MRALKLLRNGMTLLLAATMAHSLAQTLQPAAPDTSAPPVPVVDPGVELKGAALVEALRQGGLVLYMRHALQIPPTSEVCDKSNLTEVGEMQARKVGEAIRSLGIPVGAVESSQPCRSRDTARLLAWGKVDVTEDLNPMGPMPKDNMSAARARRLAKAPQPGTNSILVSHVHGGRNKADRIQLEIAEVIVYRPDGKGGAQPLARIRLEAWEDLARHTAK